MMIRLSKLLVAAAFVGVMSACVPPVPDTGDCANPGPGADLHNCNFSGLSEELVFLDLKGANLRGAAFSGSNLYGTDLRGADLAGANLDDASMGEARLDQANLTGASLRGAYLSPAHFEQANLTNTRFDGASINGGSFVSSIMTGAVFAGATISGTDFSDAVDADFTGATVCGATVPSGGLDFSGCPEQDPPPPAFYTSDSAPSVGDIVTVRGKGCPGGNPVSATLQLAPNAPVPTFDDSSDEFGRWSFTMSVFGGLPSGDYDLSVVCGGPGGFVYSTQSLSLP